ncbi:S-adenosyl-L-methionine-dependent methyltransferase [Acephala macrosclerotiorum]|nr:S-adenosyl-L-methionine-dependent methyltransferase [Acephala macrosclerotiorum]
MSTPTPDVRARLVSHFSAATGSTEHGTKWDELYQTNFLPWDKGFPSPALVDLLSSSPPSKNPTYTSLLPSPSGSKKLKALIPGCGKGYDVLLLAANGYDAYGLEISSNALKEAKKVEKEKGNEEVYATRPGVERGAVTWVVGDFFEDMFLRDVFKEGEIEKFDLIYDYTFLSALPPVMRPAWSRRFNELLAPEGRLICLEFPTYKPASTGGPPWALPPKIYMAHLPRPGQELEYGEDGELLEEKLGEPSSSGLVRIAHFQPERTHEIGYSSDGKVTDWISVWAHPKA